MTEWTKVQLINNMQSVGECVPGRMHLLREATWNDACFAKLSFDMQAIREL